jgi:hypothetical protein
MTLVVLTLKIKYCDRFSLLPLSQHRPAAWTRIIKMEIYLASDTPIITIDILTRIDRLLTDWQKSKQLRVSRI